MSLDGSQEIKGFSLVEWFRAFRYGPKPGFTGLRFIVTGGFEGETPAFSATGKECELWNPGFYS